MENRKFDMEIGKTELRDQTVYYLFDKAKNEYVKMSEKDSHPFYGKIDPIFKKLYGILEVNGVAKLEESSKFYAIHLPEQKGVVRVTADVWCPPLSTYIDQKIKNSTPTSKNNDEKAVATVVTENNGRKPSKIRNLVIGVLIAGLITGYGLRGRIGKKFEKKPEQITTTISEEERLRKEMEERIKKMTEEQKNALSRIIALEIIHDNPYGNGKERIENLTNRGYAELIIKIQAEVNKLMGKQTPEKPQEKPQEKPVEPKVTKEDWILRKEIYKKAEENANLLKKLNIATEAEIRNVMLRLHGLSTPEDFTSEEYCQILTRLCTINCGSAIRRWPNNKIQESFTELRVQFNIEERLFVKISEEAKTAIRIVREPRDKVIDSLKESPVVMATANQNLKKYIAISKQYINNNIPGVNRNGLNTNVQHIIGILIKSISNVNEPSIRADVQETLVPFYVNEIARTEKIIKDNWNKPTSSLDEETGIFAFFEDQDENMHVMLNSRRHVFIRKNQSKVNA
ncbi:MAG: hypothetical protein ACOXZS_03115 [Bacilli bacterium]